MSEILVPFLRNSLKGDMYAMSSKLEDYCNMDAVSTNRIMIGGKPHEPFGQSYYLPVIPPEMDKVMAYLSSKEGMGLLELGYYQRHDHGHAFMIRINRVSKKVWKKVIWPEVKRMVHIRSSRFIRQRGEVSAKALRLIVEEHCDD